jgi:hypothetical protein
MVYHHLKAIMLKGASLSSERNTYSVACGVFFIALSIISKRNKQNKMRIEKKKRKTE